MSAAVFLLAFGTVAACLALHIAWWRSARPKADILAIIGVFLAFPAVAYVVAIGAAALRPGPFSWQELVAALLLHAALASTYVQTYPAAQAQSPTLCMLLAIGAEKDGLDREGIVAALDASSLVGDRVDDLRRNALMRIADGRVVLTPIGRFLAGFYRVYRGWLGLHRMGG